MEPVGRGVGEAWPESGSGGKGLELSSGRESFERIFGSGRVMSGRSAVSALLLSSFSLSEGSRSRKYVEAESLTFCVA